MSQVPEQCVDVVVVGGGLAGMCAATRAQELGARTVVLEKMDELGGGTRLTQGILHICHLPLDTPPDELYEGVMEATYSEANPTDVHVLTDNANRALQWILDQGVKFEDHSDMAPVFKYVLAPRRLAEPGPIHTGKGGEATLKTLNNAFSTRGGTIYLNTAGVSLILKNRKITGITARTDKGSLDFRCQAVVLASGGFEGNKEMLVKYIGPHADLIKLRNVGPQLSGDGIIMGERAGAKLVGMDHFYGHALSRDSLENEWLWPYPTLDSLIHAGIIVKKSGERFVDEGKGGKHVCNIVAKSEDPRGTVVVFDTLVWNTIGTMGELGSDMGAANPLLIKNGATVHQADTLEALADKAGICRVRFLSTVREFNLAVEKGEAADLPVPRTGIAYKIVKPPFLAVPMVAGITFTTGGLATDPKARVLDTKDEPIPGLYAAGEVVGREGVHDWTGGLSQALILGLLAGEGAASFLKSSNVR